MINRIDASMMSAACRAGKHRWRLRLWLVDHLYAVRLGGPEVVGISSTRPATQKTPQASSTAGVRVKDETVHIGARHAVAP
jgi:hypothetical protein